MLDMSRRKVFCSTIRQATTAVESKESARKESHKEEALWRIGLDFGFVFDLEDFLDTWHIADLNLNFMENIYLTITMAVITS
jgi:hypothetical protein